MASWSKKLTQFNPYIKQVPVEDYANVLMQKQAMYDEGVKMANDQVESIAGLDVIHPEQKKYLEQRYNQLKSEVSKVASEDFSNRQLTDQIGNLANTIRKDPIIQTAQASTAAYRKGLAQMEKAKSEGKSGVVNEWDFQDKAAKWLSNPDARSQFNGEYRPYTDVRKKVLDLINKDIPETERITQVPWVTDASGQPVLKDGNIQIAPALLETTFKGRNPQAIISGIMASLDDNDIEQLGMEGRYHFQGQTPEDLKSTMDKSYQSKLDFYSDKLDDLDNKKRLNPQDKNYQTRIDEEIKAVKKQADDLNKVYPENIKNLARNPEQFKSTFYIENYLEQLGNAFSYPSKESYKYETNPFQAQANWEADFNQRAQKQIDDLRIKERDYQLELMKANKAKESGLIENPYFSAGETEVPKPSIDVFTHEIEQDEAQLNTLKNTMLKTLYPGMDRKQAEAKLLELQKGNDEGTAEPLVAAYFQDTETLTNELKNKKAILASIGEEADRIYKKEDSFKGRANLKVGDDLFTPEEVFNFDRKMREATTIISNSGTMGRPYIKFDKDKATSSISEKERFLYNAYVKADTGEKTNKSEDFVNAYRQKLVSDSNPEVAARIKAKKEFVNQKLGEKLPAYVPERYIIPAEKTETRYFAKANVDNILSDAQLGKESVGDSPNFDFDTAKKLNGNDKTTYGVFKSGRRIFLTLAGDGEKTQYLAINEKNAGQMFPDKFNRPFDRVQNAILAAGGTSTNIRGMKDGRASDYSTAFFYKQDFPGVSKYGLRGDVEVVPTGGYQFRLYAFDPAKKEWITKAFPQRFYNANDLIQVKSQIGDLAVEQMFNIKAPEQK